MLSLLLELSSRSTSVIVVCALGMGVVFDRMENGPRQRLALGLVGGAACLAAFALADTPGVPMAASGIALVLMTGLYAGTRAALIAFALPIATCAEVGGVAAVGACGTVIAAGALGVGARALLHHRHHRSVERRMVLAVAAVGAVVLAIPLAVASDAPGERYVPLLLWLLFSSAVFGLLVASEKARAGTGREERQQTALLKETRQVSAEMLETQLRHHWQLHDRYGVQFAFLAVAVDESAALRRALSPAAWQELRAQIARHIREAVRDCDMCGPLSASRTGILLPYIGPAAMVRVAERIRDAVGNAEFRFDQPVSVSVGMAHVDEVNGPDDLRLVAENAMLVARTATPRGAIGPARPKEDRPAPLIRAFPGLILSRVPPQAAGEAHPDLDALSHLTCQPPDREAA